MLKLYYVAETHFITLLNKGEGLNDLVQKKCTLMHDHAIMTFFNPCRITLKEEHRWRVSKKRLLRTILDLTVMK